MEVIDGARVSIPSIPSPATHALLGAIILGLRNTKKGRRGLEQALNSLEEEIDSHTATRLDGHRISPATLEGMKQAAAALRGLLGLRTTGTPTGQRPHRCVNSVPTAQFLSTPTVRRSFQCQRTPLPQTASAGPPSLSRCTSATMWRQSLPT